MYRPYHPAADSAVVRSLTERQQELARLVQIQKPDFTPALIAGCDSSFIGDTILSVFVVLTYPDLELVETQWHHGLTELPYIPGFLAFREAPNLLRVYEKLQAVPDLIMVDGHGISHPRRLGIASHLGVLLQKPTMGVAKKILVGKYEEPGPGKGAYTPLIHRGDLIGYTLRTKEKVKPVFVSPGHLMDLETAMELALGTSLKHKLPEPTRLADHYAEVYKQEVR
ncbi:deoxyribonuclease V [soil metagenome]